MCTLCCMHLHWQLYCMHLHWLVSCMHLHWPPSCMHLHCICIDNCLPCIRINHCCMHLHGPVSSMQLHWPLSCMHLYSPVSCMQFHWPLFCMHFHWLLSCMHLNFHWWLTIDCLACICIDHCLACIRIDCEKPNDKMSIMRLPVTVISRWTSGLPALAHTCVFTGIAGSNPNIPPFLFLTSLLFVTQVALWPLP
jgi:hypothetical protein